MYTATSKRIIVSRYIISTL